MSAGVVGVFPTRVNAPIDNAKPKTRSESVSMRCRVIGARLFLGNLLTIHAIGVVCPLGSCLDFIRPIADAFLLPDRLAFNSTT